MAFVYFDFCKWIEFSWISIRNGLVRIKHFFSLISVCGASNLVLLLFFFLGNIYTKYACDEYIRFVNFTHCFCSIAFCSFNGTFQIKQSKTWKCMKKVKLIFANWKKEHKKTTSHRNSRSFLESKQKTFNSIQLSKAWI